jgi:hypothetical protein
MRHWPESDNSLLPARAQSDAAPELQPPLELIAVDIEKVIAERTNAEKTRNFARAHAYPQGPSG